MSLHCLQLARTVPSDRHGGGVEWATKLSSVCYVAIINAPPANVTAHGLMLLERESGCSLLSACHLFDCMSLPFL